MKESASQNSASDMTSDHGSRTAQELRALQDTLCEHLAAADGSPFQSDPWDRPMGGGGLTRVIVNGGLFEKGGVLFSAINGDRLPPVVLRDHPEISPDTPYFATGVSLILHPENPYIPSVHFNVRYFEAGERFWYGGGMDLTPYYPFHEDCVHFHKTIKACCDRFNREYYDRFKTWCDRYFYLPHRGEARGIGGIFFNDLSEDRARGLDFILALGDTFLKAYLPVVQHRRELPFGEREREFQWYRRGRYVEFNLIYDQGTLFGLQSGGRVESILVSLPPHASWKYDWKLEPGSPEELLARQYLVPRNWISEAEGG